MSDKMNKKTILVFTKEYWVSYHTHTHTYLNPPLMCLLCVCLYINIIIAYTKVRKPSLFNAPAYHSHLLEPSIF